MDIRQEKCDRQQSFLIEYETEMNACKTSTEDNLSSNKSDFIKSLESESGSFACSLLHSESFRASSDNVKADTDDFKEDDDKLNKDSFEKSSSSQVSTRTYCFHLLSALLIEYELLIYKCTSIFLFESSKSSNGPQKYPH